MIDDPIKYTDEINVLTNKLNVFNNYFMYLKYFF